MDIKQLGPYRLGRVLGRGGMGTVYLGVHEESGEHVALKVLAPAYANDESFRERFDAEVRSLEKLRHPNIVELKGFGEQYGALFFAMEYVDGTTLQHELGSGRRFHWREVIQHGIAICGALKHAHDHGVIHRDLKPANLLITPDDRIKLTDFGIAKLFGDNQMTADGGVLGTADYMAPEQAEGLKVTTRCDLYSLGAVFYALLSGSPPFMGKSLPEVVHKVRFEPPIPIGRLVFDIPRELELLVDQLLSKDPVRRVPTALALSNRLQAIQHALSVERTRDDTPDVTDQELEAEAVTWFDDGPSTLPEEREAASRPTRIITKAPPRPVNTVNTMETIVPSEVGASASSSTTGGEARKQSAPTFVPVDAEYRRRNERPPADVESWTERLVKWGGVAFFGLLVAGGGWWIFRPPTSDALYHTITSMIDKTGMAGVVRVEEELGEFLRRFPEDPRAAEIESLQKSLELLQLERSLRMRARYDKGDDKRSPLEVTLVRVLYFQDFDPQTAAVHLRSLLDVYANTPSLSERDQKCIELAEQWLKRIQPQVVEVNKDLRAMIRSRLVHAAQLQAKDPKEAQKIWQGIVTLYDEQAWAADLVEDARQHLPR